jgi:hypothetical protein
LITLNKEFFMKNVFLAFVLALVCGTTFAGSCPCERTATVTKTVVTTTEVVKAPVRVVGGLRSRVAARRAARLEARAAKAEAVAAACCPAAGCECEPKVE